MPSYRLSALAQEFGLQRVGDLDPEITGVCALFPGRPGGLSFCADKRLRAGLATSHASAIIISAADAQQFGGAALIAANPAVAFAHIASRFDHRSSFSEGRHASAQIDASARIGAGCWIGANTVIEAGAVIGENSFIGPNCVIGANVAIGVSARLQSSVDVGADCRLGARVHILPGAVIGTRGFGLAHDKTGWIEVPQLGTVIIGDDVEIGANTSIDRGALDDTVIEDGVKLDNQIQIAHNCRIGAHTAIAACVGVAGSAQIGKRCLIGGQAGIAGHIKIVDDVVLLAGTMVSSSITQKGAYGSTMTALPVRDWRKMVARFRRWSAVENRLRKIERSLSISDKVSLTEGYGIEDGGRREQDD